MNDDNLREKLFTDHKLRAKVTGESHQWFFTFYFWSYMTHETADMHRELFAITEDTTIPLSVVVAFRGSAKSTIMTMSYPIWAIVGVQQKKFVLIASQTQHQARMHLINIKHELESNELLANDMGPFIEHTEEWGATSLSIPKYNARIIAISTEQSIRGIRHGPHRPDLIIADDVENMASVKTREGRNKTFDWYTGEIIPSGDTDTKRIAIGNLLHEDSLLMRLREKIENDEIDGIYKEFPIKVDQKSLWPDKYPDEQSIIDVQRKTASKIAWEREYMLNIIADEDQIIDPAWIKFYEELPVQNEANQFIGTYLGVDLAISLKDTADYTAIVIVHVYGYEDEDRRYFIDKHFINKRMSHLNTIETIDRLFHALPSKIRETRVLVEAVAYQVAAIEQLRDRNIKTGGVKINGDKHSRLMTAGMLFEQGKVFFPKNDDKAIIRQILGFNVEKHDDLCDALTLVLNYVQTNVEYGIFAIFNDNDPIYSVFYKDKDTNWN